MQTVFLTFKDSLDSSTNSAKWLFGNDGVLGTNKDAMDVAYAIVVHSNGVVAPNDGGR